VISMNEDFKKKLKDYTEGKLSEEEKRTIEIDIEKLEQYQEFLEEDLEKVERPKEVKKTSRNKRQAKIIRGSKWKARLQNAFTVIGILIIFTFISSLITDIFYSTGEPSRSAIYRDVVKSTIAVTKPNVTFRGGSASKGSYFTLRIKGNLEKRVGGDDVVVGQVDKKFFFSKTAIEGVDIYENQDEKVFFYSPKILKEGYMNKDWNKLEKLPEGTVAEVFISLDKLYETDEILGKLKDREIKPIWFAVDTGDNDKDLYNEPVIVYPIGFPYETMWHEDDMILTDKTEKKVGMFTKVETKSSRSPDVEPYGSGKLRNENFIKTLKLIKKYEGIATNISSYTRLNVKKRIDYINVNGVKIYGIVITGPSKEILKLKQEQWVKGISVGEVGLWNWE